MDIFMPLAICVFFILLFLICGWCCKRKREGTVYGYGPTVQVSSQPVHASPVVVPPYPIDPRHPTPQSGALPPVFSAPQGTPYPTNVPYPQAVPVPTYQTPPIGAGNTVPYPPISAGAHTTPYPPAAGTDYSRPPPYDVAVSQPPVQPSAPTKEGYSKQLPFNPNY